MPFSIPRFFQRPSALRISVAFPALLVGAACAPEAPREGEELEETTSSIINGRISGAADDAVVRVFQDFGDGSYGTCTGTLLAPNLVLTARHCVEAPPPPAPDPPAAPPDPDLPGAGAPAATPPPDPNAAINVNCDDFGPNAPPSAFRIAIGNQNDPAGFDRVAALAAKIFTPQTPNICGNDVALLQLDRKIPKARTKRIRMTPVKKGERNLTTVGFGLYASTPDATPATRRKRSGLQILAIGGTTGSWFRSVDNRRYRFVVAPNDLATGESSCNGDSGGPLFDRSGALVAVSSRGLNVPSRCLDTPAIYAGLAAHQALLREAAQAVGLEL